MVAASLVAAFFLGRIGSPQTHPTAPAPVSKHSSDVIQPSVRSAVTPAENALAHRAASNAPQILADTTPAALPEIWTQPLEVPQDVRHSLRTLGMELHHHNGLAPAENRAGQPVWVPYRDVTIVPVSNYKTY